MQTKVVVNGTFDILHTGHVCLLNFAKSLGDHLLVCIDTDRRVKELKGDSRPINTQEERKFLLENLKAVDEVRFFDSKEELIQILIEYQADIMVKGSDYKGKSKTGQLYCKEVIYYDRIEEFSTTKKIQDITSR
jgi:D-beta-D-heptose 7-phosphate kinase/D-beta-D-heptose 1-phosphate adenosyltransferase